MAVQKGINITNVAGNVGPFGLDGGTYGVDAVATFGGGTVKLQKQAGDASSYVDVASFSAAGYSSVTIPYGTYRIAVTTATAVYVQIYMITKADV